MSLRSFTKLGGDIKNICCKAKTTSPTLRSLALLEVRRNAHEQSTTLLIGWSRHVAARDSTDHGMQLTIFTLPCRFDRSMSGLNAKYIYQCVVGIQLTAESHKSQIQK